MKLLVWGLAALIGVVLCIGIVIVLAGKRAGQIRAEKLRWGFVNSSGELVISAIFDEVRGFSEGLAAVRVGDSWGYIDKTGEMIISASFGEARDFASNGLAAARPIDSDLFGYINRNGEWVIQPAWERASRFSAGVAQVGSVSDIATSRITSAQPVYHYGLVDEQGEMIHDLAGS